jgi:NAD(P)-dependent dehydrogenase (short-subunit alcohol dehydrogenase family)
MTGRFSKSVVLVTGSTSGIGRETALAFAREGATVVVSGRREQAGRETAAEAKAAGGTAVYVQADVREPDDLVRLVESTAERYGRIDILVNNAAVEATEGDDGPDLAGWDTMFATNVRAPWIASKTAIPHLLRTNGVIVNVASMAGLVGWAAKPGYAASKAALVSLTKSMGLAYADRGVRVVAVCPGPIDTDTLTAEWGSHGHPEEARSQTLAATPMGRIGQPTEVVAVILFVASTAASFITGAAIPVDGAKSSGLMTSDRYRVRT